MEKSEWTSVVLGDTYHLSNGVNELNIPDSVTEALGEWLIGNRLYDLSKGGITATIEGGEIAIYDADSNKLLIPIDRIDKLLDLIGLEIKVNETEPAEENTELEVEGPAVITHEQYQDEKPTKKRRQQRAVAKQLMQSPIPTAVYRIAYIECGSCNTITELGGEPDYDGKALNCPQCNSIILLIDRERDVDGN